MSDKLERLFKESFEIDHLEDSMAIDNIEGWDSLAHVGLITALEKEFNISIPPIDAVNLTSVLSIKQYLTQRGVR
jgi:acyl carrier protein